MKRYDIAVIGAGPAGMMAAIRAGSLGKRVILIEKNEAPGRKILLTGRGRCNLTNSGKLDTFMEKFGPSGQFLRTALNAFSNEELMDFFKSRGLELKTERQGRVFPATDSAASVVHTLEKCLKESNVELKYSARLQDIKFRDGVFSLDTGSPGGIEVEKVILAAGGASYKVTGSTGEVFHIAQRLGHNVAPLKPGLVPLRTREEWVKDLQGLALKNIRVVFIAGKKKITSEVGELLFTHFGVSGPLILDLSGEIVRLLETHKELALNIDLKPGIRNDEMEGVLLKDFKLHGGKELKNMLTSLMPAKLVPVIVKLTNIDGHKKIHQMSKAERRALAQVLKAMPLTITGSLPLEEAMVTCGGVSIKEINPRTMESRLVKGLYFAGEMIEGGAPSGGYNLQQAFSTGYLAGESASA